MSSGTDLMTVAQYAQHRRVSDSYIRRMRRLGKLVVEGRLIRVAASDAVLDNTTDPVRGGNRNADASSEGRRDKSEQVQEAIRRERMARAQLAELELAEKAGELTRRAGVERAVFTLVRQALNRLQAIKGRLRGRLAAETDPLQIDVLLDEEVFAICEEMREAARTLIAEAQASAALEEGHEAEAEAA